MNLICAILLTLWVSGWAVASLRAVLQARAANAARDYPTGIPIKSGISGR
jgi:hypothetical protein